MSLEGLLAIAGIALAIYAIPGPAQRRSITLFVPRWLLPVALVASAIIVLSAEWLTVHQPEVYGKIRFSVMLSTFALPVIATVLAVWLWNRAKLTRGVAHRFHAFLLACLREKTFDELVRVLEKNIDRIASTLGPESLDLLFEPRFVQAMTRARTWLHVRLLSSRELVERLPSPARTIDTVMRAYVAEPGSILHARVAHSYGAEEHSFCTGEDWKLIDKTLSNPEWYMGLRVDYPLLIVACEHLDSGRLDEAYNRNDRLYIAHQGISSRVKCPVFVAIKTHVLMLEEAVKKRPFDDMDYYVSDLWDVFRTICDHCRYAQDVWEGHSANTEYPTPYAYLLSQILLDLKLLCEHYFSHGQRAPGQLGREFAMIWSLCVAYLAESEGRVSPQMQRSALYRYLDHILEVRDYRHGDGADNQRQQNCDEWSEMFVEQTKRNVIANGGLKPLMEKIANGLDICKDHVSRNEAWLRTELGLPARSKSSR